MGQSQKQQQDKWKCPDCSLDFKLETARFQSENAFERLEMAMTNFEPLPDVFWQQPQETSNNHRNLDNIYNESAIRTDQTTQELENKQITEEASQAPHPKEIQQQRSVRDSPTATVHVQETQTGNGLAPFLNHSNICPTEIQESGKHIKTTLNGEWNNAVKGLSVQ